MQEALATKIRCQHCNREIWIPIGGFDKTSNDKFYCCLCGQYTSVNGEKVKLDDEEFRDKHRD